MSGFIRMLIVMLSVLAAIRAVESHTKTDCGVAQTAFGMCVPYVMGDERGPVSSSCCAAVKSVEELSSMTSMGKRGVCDCLRAMMAEVGRIDGRRASGLARKCGVRTSVIPTSLRFRCFE
ncbi:uncharacterized protein A4U43_C06F11840 [Asparagus officinalis]|uniref:Bifunctional inhibitor/plant lipid transfer protein/seed storage helical domain-containing protein n=2 Tax=Asparagus officinalis TaxID=4686 RepID=A0A5P1EL99_ASPOF|nr:uncharacterized protein A4U43_C06F8820 [Asparagus officinalis]ONK66775.1 uncharacterized protein A4U43_C06F11840 [Asparagus officinalis]